MVVLSHLHGDHTGGLADFLGLNRQVEVYLLDSSPRSLKRKVTDAGAQLVVIRESEQICQGAFLTGQMGNVIPEQALVLKTGQGLAIITGCAHPGITGVIERGCEIGEGSAYLVMGGFHLCGAFRQRVGEILDKFQDLGVVKVSPCHCTGPEAIKMFREAYGEDYIQNGVGQVITLER